MLGEAGDVAGDGLEPVQTVLSCGKLDDPAAHSVHGDDLERVFPGRRGEEERIGFNENLNGSSKSSPDGMWGFWGSSSFPNIVLIKGEGGGYIKWDYSDYCTTPLQKVK